MLLELHRLNEAKKPARAPTEWGITYSPIFESSLIEQLQTFPDLADKLARFVAIKKPNPVAATCGKHDRPMTGELVGLWHCHLRDDAVLIYRLKNHCIHFVCIVTHAQIEGKRLKMTRSRIKSAGELPESLADRIVHGFNFLTF